MSRNCEVCGALLPLQTGRGGRRKRCATCPRPRGKAAQAAKARAAKNWTPDAILKPPSDLDSPGPTCERTRVMLLDLGVWQHPLASAAMALAERIDSGREPGTALASVAKQLQSILAELQAAAAADQADSEPDPIEEFRRRRAERAARAAAAGE